MFNKISIILLILVLSFSCIDETDPYYVAETETTVNTDILTLLKQNPDYSQFVALLEKYKVDSILESGKIYTFFVPNNTVISSMQLGMLSEKEFVEYSMTESFVNLNQIIDKKKIQTFGGKFIEIQNSGVEGFTYDGVSIVKGSPLANNGRFYEIASNVMPKPSLLEYISSTNGFYTSFIRSLDSVYLDKQLSTPIGYTPEGLTIYDSVTTKINMFEQLYFPVSQEFKDRKATMLLFTQAQYEQAISKISTDLGISTDRVPAHWQNNVLMPFLIKQTVFRNALPFTSFMVGRAKNILGDSVVVVPTNISPNFIECSNGRVFNLIDFKVPEELYKVNSSVPMTNLIYTKGTNLWGWNSDVLLTGQQFNPVRAANAFATTANTLLVDMGKNFTGQFSLAYKHKNIFPATYKFTLRANVSKTGIYKILVNNKQYPVDIKDGKGPRLDFDFYDLRSGVISPVTNKFFPFKDNFCTFELFIDNITEYGDIEVKLVYVKPSPRNLNNCGLNIDFISLEFYKK